MEAGSFEIVGLRITVLHTLQDKQIRERQRGRGRKRQKQLDIYIYIYRERERGNREERQTDRYRDEKRETDIVI